MNLKDAKYLTRYKNDIIIFVSPTKLMDRLEMDSPTFAIRSGKNQIGNRVQRAKEYILKNWDNPDRKKNFKNWLYQIFQPSVCGFDYNGGLSFSDGRHRVLAAEELGIPEVAIEIPRNQEKLFDYMKVSPTTNESPDYVEMYGLDYCNDDSVPFGCYVHNGEMNVGIGCRGCMHGSIEGGSRIMKGSEIFNEYTGRVWLKKKIISFWEFPEREEFIQIIDELETVLRKKGHIRKGMWNNGWRVEIIKVMGKIPIDMDFDWPKESEYDEITHKEILNRDIELIPIEDYLKSQDFPDELKKIHLMSSTERDSLRKSGKDPMKYWNSLGKKWPLAYRQAIYQESIKSMDDTVNKFIKLFDIFLKSTERNKWICVTGFKMYVRKSKRFYNGKAVDFIDLASIESDTQGTGLFTLILKEILKKYKDRNFYVENIMTDRFLNFFKKFGFIDYPMYDRCLIKISNLLTIESVSYEDVKSKFKKDILYPLKKESLKFDNFKDFSESYSIYGNHGLYFHLTNNPDWKYNSEIGSRDMSSMSDGMSEKGSFMVTSDLENWDWYYNYDEDENPRTSGTRDYVAVIDLSDCKYHIGFGRGFGHEIYLYPNEAKKAILLDVLPIKEGMVLYKKFRGKMPESEEALYKIWEDSHKSTNEKMITKFKDFENLI